MGKKSNKEQIEVEKSPATCGKKIKSVVAMVNKAKKRKADNIDSNNEAEQTIVRPKKSNRRGKADNAESTAEKILENEDNEQNELLDYSDVEEEITHPETCIIHDGIEVQFSDDEESDRDVSEIHFRRRPQ